MKNILVLDDDPVTLEIVKTELDDLKEYKVLLASNGVEGLEILNSTKIDIIITDILMPEFDGVQLISYLKENHIDIPVLVITSVKDTDLIDQIINLGITNIFKKPIDFTDMKKKIDISVKAYSTFEKTLDLLPLCKLFAIEKRSSEISVIKENSSGSLCIEKGKIVFAEFESLKGSKSVEKMFSLKDIKVNLKGKCQRIETNVSDTDWKSISEKFFKPAEEKLPELDISKINKAVEKLKRDLGSGLLATSIWNTINLNAVAEFNYDQKSFTGFNSVEAHLNIALKRSGFPELDEYYILNMKNNRLVLVILLENYHWGLMVKKSKGIMGVLMSIVLPELQNVFKSSIS